MSVNIRRYGAVNPPRDTTTTILTVPTGQVGILRSIHQGSNGSSDMGVLLFGLGFIWKPPVDTTNGKLYGLSTVMPAGTTLAANHGAGTVDAYTAANVALLDVNREGRDLWSLVRGDIGNTATGGGGNTSSFYIVPAGKRLRVREVVICAHGNVSNVSVYISGIVHLLKTTTKANTAAIFGMDMSAGPGETLGWSSSVVNVHLFMSGVLEDA